MGDKKAIIIFFLILVSAGLIGYNLIYQRGLDKIAALKLQQQEERDKNALLEVISQLDERLKGYGNRSFSAVKVTPLLNRLSEFAKRAEIEIETFNPQPVIAHEQYIELPVKIPLGCSYHRLGEFLSLIESNQQFIWVKGIRMQKPTVTDPREKRAPQITLDVSGIYLKK